MTNTTMDGALLQSNDKNYNNKEPYMLEGKQYKTVISSITQNGKPVEQHKRVSI